MVKPVSSIHTRCALHKELSVFCIVSSYWINDVPVYVFYCCSDLSPVAVPDKPDKLMLKDHEDMYILSLCEYYYCTCAVGTINSVIHLCIVLLIIYLQSTCLYNYNIIM